MNRLGRALVGIVVLTVGATAVYFAPQTSDVGAPIDYRGSVGDRIVGRAYATTVTGLRFARTLRLKDGTTVSTPGVWLVADLRVTARLRPVLLQYSTLRVGKTSWAAYHDPRGSDFSGAAPDPGITAEGTLVFELPERVRGASAADMILSRGAVNPDQQNVVGFDPRRIPVVDDATVVPQTPVRLEFPWGR